MQFIDLRSDTVTGPTPEMREAMARAEVGDDVYGDDPTVNRLQDLAADRMGKAAALFVPSGTMGNLAGILAHCQRGDEVILGKQNHTYLHEAGGISVLGGVHSCQLANQPDGSLLLSDIEAAIRADDQHEPITRLVCLENSHNHCGGTVQTAETTRRIAEFAHGRGLKVHLDGARIFNAAAALNVNVKELTAPVDTVTFCLSKGLCAPVGSVLCGDQEFIGRAHRLRKMLGGGMRQAGILAAAGIVALEKMTTRLGEDHARARTLAEGLSENRGIVLDGAPQTNMVFFNLAPQVQSSTDEITDRLKQHGILVSASGVRRFRLVTHYWIDDPAVERTVAAFHEVLQ
ncbi:MAG TPA: low-specificity L-threonine aldolase [Anaerolineales bacterium]|nr:low-specificity L-threonine aldolase [Anaerolineales bacterium]